MTYVLAERLGGRRVLRKTVRTELDLADAIHDGLPIETVDRILDSGLLEPAELFSLVIPRRTLSHRRRTGRLTPEQSDRLARVVRILTRAEEVFADPEKASRWMRKPNRALEGRRPLDLLESDTGSRAVEKILLRIEHGVYS
jgi:putative toxin-antitoxin system antitoxin component (TIGR02293 family)